MKSGVQTGAAWVLVGAMAAIGGCEQALGLDKDYQPEDAASDAALRCAPLPEAGAKSCPDAGGSMKAVPGGYCIDRTEVTWGQYTAWLDAGASPAKISQPEPCRSNATFQPAGPQPTAQDGGPTDQYPVAFVDWCDAYAFCQDHGKRLCGQIGGDSTPFTQYAACGVDQWYTVCSNAGKTRFPFGDTPDPSRCNGDNTVFSDVWEVGYGTRCQTSPEVGGLAYIDIYDMVGNVGEWQDCCQADSCRARGGWFFQGADQQKADCLAARELNRDSHLSYVGFRCCAD